MSGTKTPGISRGQHGGYSPLLGVDIAKGAIPGHSTNIKFGDNEAVGTSERVLWGTATASDNYFPTTAVTVSLASTSANDTSAGTGARTVTVTYMGTDFIEYTETVTLNGQTPVALTNQVYRSNRMVVDTAGSGGANAGTIYLFEGTATAGVPDDVDKIINAITPDHNQTTSTFFTVPKDKRALIMWGFVSSVGNARSTIKFRVRDNGVFRVKFDFDLKDNSVWYDLRDTPFVCDEGTDMEVTGKMDTGTGRISASYGIIMIDWSD